MSDKPTITVGDRSVAISSPDKEMVRGVTKLDLAEHWARVGERTIAHAHGRLVSAKRAPDGAKGDVFFQKNIPAGMPSWVSHAMVPSESSDDGQIDHVILDDAGHLVALAQFGTIEVHVGTWSVDAPFQPREIILDLDPPPTAPVEHVRSAAAQTLALCDELDLPTMLKTTGSKGFHVHVPITGCDQPRARAVAQQLAEELARRHPDDLTTEFKKEDRRGRVLVDWWRNGGGATAVAVWSPRVAPRAPVAVPIQRDELDDVVPDQWGIADIEARLGAAGDPWADAPSPTDLSGVPDDLA